MSEIKDDACFHTAIVYIPFCGESWQDAKRVA